MQMFRPDARGSWRKTPRSLVGRLVWLWLMWAPKSTKATDLDLKPYNLDQFQVLPFLSQSWNLFCLIPLIWNNRSPYGSHYSWIDGSWGQKNVEVHMGNWDCSIFKTARLIHSSHSTCIAPASCWFFRVPNLWISTWFFSGHGRL